MIPQYFPLNRKEKTWQSVMLSSLAIFFLTLFTGLYTQSHNINFDGIMVPLLMFSAGLFYLLIGLNTFGNGNLVLKWTFFGLPQLLQYVLGKWFSFPPRRARGITVFTFGFLSLLAASFILFLGALALIKGV